MKSFAEIIRQIKYHKGLNTEGEVANALGITRAALSGHKKRGTLPLQSILIYCQKEGLDFMEAVSDISFPAERGPYLPTIIDKGISSKEYPKYIEEVISCIENFPESRFELIKIIKYLSENPDDRKDIFRLVALKEETKKLLKNIATVKEEP